MEQNRVTGEPYNKGFLGKELIHYKRQIPFCLLSEKSHLNLKAMDVTYTF